MKKRIILVILSFLLININIILAGDEILLKSRRFITDKGIAAAAKANIEAIAGRAHVLIQFEQIPTIKERKGGYKNEQGTKEKSEEAGLYYGKRR